MSRKTWFKTRGAVAAAAALALVGTALTANSASAATGVITRVGPLKAPLDAAVVITVTGSALDDSIDYATFTTGTTTCGTDQVQVVSTTLAYVKTPATGCAAGVQVLKLYSGGSSGTLAATGPSLASSTVTFALAPALATSSPVLPATASVYGGSSATATVQTALPATSTVQVWIGGVSAAGRVVATAPTKITFLVPPGKPGTASIKVVANGLTSATVASTHANAFVYKSALKITPVVWVKGAAAPSVRVEGVGFKPTLSSGTNSTPVVTFCGVAGTVATSGTKAYNNTVLYVTPPAWSASFPANTVSATDGGVCTVKVSVDDDGSGSGTTTTDSVVTAGSSFTYAAY